MLYNAEILVIQARRLSLSSTLTKRGLEAMSHVVRRVRCNELVGWNTSNAVGFCVWTDLGSSSASSQQPERKRTKSKQQSAAAPKPWSHCGARRPNFFAQREMPQVGSAGRSAPRSCTVSHGRIIQSVRTGNPTSADSVVVQMSNPTTCTGKRAPPDRH